MVERAYAQGHDLLDVLLREARSARIDRGLSQDEVAAALGVDRSRISRLELGQMRDVGIVELSQLLAAVGLELSARAYPAANAVRTSVHALLLDRLRVRIHSSLEWATEVPLPGVGDLRAWDAVITGRGWRFGVEAETRPRDLQALERRIALKERDGDVQGVILLLLASRHNREFVAAYGESLRSRFPLTGAELLRALTRGLRPRGSGLILL